MNVHSFIKQDAAEPRSPHKVAGHLWYSPSLDCFCCNAAYGNCPSALPVVWCCSQQPADMPESGCVLAIQEGICFTSAQRVCRLTQPSAARVQLPAQMQRCMSTLTASSPSSFSCAQCCSSRHMGQCKAAAFSSGAMQSFRHRVHYCSQPACSTRGSGLIPAAATFLLSRAVSPAAVQPPNHLHHQEGPAQVPAGMLLCSIFAANWASCACRCQT